MDKGTIQRLMKQIVEAIPGLHKAAGCVHWRGPYCHEVPVITARVGGKSVNYGVRAVIREFQGTHGRPRMRCGNKTCINPNHFKVMVKYV